MNGFFGLFVEEKKKKETLKEVTVSANGTTYFYDYTKEVIDTEKIKKKKAKGE